MELGWYSTDFQISFNCVHVYWVVTIQESLLEKWNVCFSPVLQKEYGSALLARPWLINYWSFSFWVFEACFLCLLFSQCHFLKHLQMALLSHVRLGLWYFRSLQRKLFRHQYLKVFPEAKGSRRVNQRYLRILCSHLISVTVFVSLYWHFFRGLSTVSTSFKR